MCPASNPGRDYCNQPGDNYCGYWGCETIATGWTNGYTPDPHLKWEWGPKGCLEIPTTFPYWSQVETTCYLTLKVNTPTDFGWTMGRAWGARLWGKGTGRAKATRGLIFIQKTKLYTKPIGIGPNSVLLKVATPQPKLPTNSSHPNSSFLQKNALVTDMHHDQVFDRLYNLILGSFAAINYTQPRLTESCWLCLSAAPPYYEGIALNRTYITHSTGANCDWERGHKLTLSDITGQGTCIGNPPPHIQSLCATTHKIRGKHRFLQPPVGLKWVCNTGITPCISTTVFNNSADYCVMVSIYPRVLYHTGPELENKFLGLTRSTREPVTITLAVIMGATTTASLGVGIAALEATNQHSKELRQAIDVDLRKLEKSVEALETSLTSLSEVVLQNRRGLDLLFLKDRGLCAALKEECCFYADHTGVVRESMRELKERLDQRQKEYDDNVGMFQSWFDKSPWLTTLLSAIAGPIIIILLLVTIGPCIINHLMNFVRKQVGNVKLMVLRQQYQYSTLPMEDESRL